MDSLGDRRLVDDFDSGGDCFVEFVACEFDLGWEYFEVDVSSNFLEGVFEYVFVKVLFLMMEVVLLLLILVFWIISLGTNVSTRVFCLFYSVFG